MKSSEIIRTVKVRSGRVHEVRFKKSNERLFLARAEQVKTIRVHSSLHGWTAHCGGGRSYHSTNPAKAFALAANDFWK
jgi:hypothetical protein